MKVMFIDDDGMILRMAGFILKKMGHEAVTASSGEEGIELMRSSLPDMVFIDVEMPVMNGFETLEAIRQDSALSGVRVCMMSGTVDDEVTGRAQQLGAIGVIDKPLNAADVAAAIGD